MLNNTQEQLRANRLPTATQDKLLYIKKSSEQMLTQLLKQLPLIDALEASLRERLKQLEKCNK